MGRDCDAYLAEVAERLPQLRGFAVADPQGRVRCAAGLSFSPEERRRPSRGSRRRCTGRRRDRRRLHRRAPDEAGLAAGGAADPHRRADHVARGDRGRPRLARRAAARAQPRPGQRAGHRRPQRRPHRARARPGRFVGTRIPEPFLSLVHADRPGTTEIMSQDGTRRILGYQPPAATGIGLYVGAGLSTDAAFAPIYASTWRSLALAAARRAGRLRPRLAARRPAVPPADPPHPRHHRQLARRRRQRAHRHRAGRRQRAGGAGGGDRRVHGQPRRRSAPPAPPPRSAARWCSRDEPPHQEHPRRGAGGRQPDLQGPGDAGEPARASAAG